MMQTLHAAVNALNLIKADFVLTLTAIVEGLRVCETALDPNKAIFHISTPTIRQHITICI
jgi:hypothetical protein